MKILGFLVLLGLFMMGAFLLVVLKVVGKGAKFLGGHKGSHSHFKKYSSSDISFFGHNNHRQNSYKKYSSSDITFLGRSNHGGHQQYGHGHYHNKKHSSFSGFFSS
ncbi:hypothetical protein [Brevibacillus dissolubilis]|uniref:hypothetical protein n=1 Tax=Brevibacillus dissolubilis TaxID=1844116 RepID=UPI0020FFF9BB|nr:hypothetical protein [Brevibacillus dissolubilis]